MEEKDILCALSATPITSRQNTRVSECAKLTDRKHRRATGRFRFDGIKLAVEALRAGAPLVTVFLRATDARRLLERLITEAGSVPQGVEILLLEDGLFDRLSEENAPEGIICVCENLPIHASKMKEDDISPQQRVMILESIRDPSNLGAIMRSAAAFDVDVLLVSDDCADIYNAKTVRASMGTLFRQNIVRVPDVPAALQTLSAMNRRTFAAALDRSARQLSSFPVQKGDCVVIGNEGHGLRPETVAAADACVYIPMTDRAESLNAAVAAALFMWEFYGKTDRADNGVGE